VPLVRYSHTETCLSPLPLITYPPQQWELIMFPVPVCAASSVVKCLSFQVKKPFLNKLLLLIKKLIIAIFSHYRTKLNQQTSSFSFSAVCPFAHTCISNLILLCTKCLSLVDLHTSVFMSLHTNVKMHTIVFALKYIWILSSSGL